MDLARAMMLAVVERDWTMIVLSVLLLLIVGWVLFSFVYGIVDEVRISRVERRRNRQAAMRRHPSAQTALAAMTPEEFQYHTSREWGR